VIAGRGAAILVVDDRPEQRLALRVVLEDLGEVVEASSGSEALRWLTRQEFAVILLDVNMPGLDGLETAELIRQRPVGRDTPILFVSADDDDEVVARGYALGAVDYIRSPIQRPILRAKAAVFLELFRKRDAERQHALQLRLLADAALAIHGATSLEDLSRRVVDAASSILQAAQIAFELRITDSKPIVLRIPAETHLQRLTCDVLRALPARPVRMGRGEIHAVWDGVLASSDRSLPAGWLAAPLLSRERHVLGWLQLSEKISGEFSIEDESLLVQVAQMAATAAENTVLSDVREANRLKDQFLAMVSHELRTPLQVILTWSRVLEGGAGDAALMGQAAQVIQRNATAQARLIDGLLDASRILAGKVRLDRSSLSLSELVHTAVAEAGPQALQKEIALGVVCPAAVTLSGDRERLRQIIDNLLSNAIKFTPHRGRIELGVHAGKTHAEVAVRDTGQGVAEEFMPHLFDHFRQAESHSTRQNPGLGLGLAVARELAELHGGTIRAESDGSGKGATFTLSVPLHPPAGDAEVAPDVGEAGDITGVLEAEEVRLEGIHVLLVEDQADLREALVLELARLGASAHAVASAADAMTAMQQRAFDVLLSDLAMPDEDGFSLIRRVRARGKTQGGAIPAAALSAYARAEDRARSLLAGFDLHLSKPIDSRTLAAAVAALAAQGGR
jgi:signal transduction histidine kinase